MTIHVDTSALVDALTGPRRLLGQFRTFVSDGHRMAICAIVLYEWLRGPRSQEERAVQEQLFPRGGVMPFGVVQAETAVRLYSAVTRSRGRELDLAVAACAISDGAALWTLNRADFRDLPNLELV